MEVIYYAACIIALIILMGTIFAIGKTCNSCTNRIIIINAIYAYHLWCFDNDADEEVDYTDMETYEETDRRWMDWGYTNILPKEKFEIIKPFIKEETK